MLYRFRSCEKLIKERELEDQYFYFGPIDDQNDISEGYINLIFHGDSIAWLGLFKNYGWMLYQHLSYVMLGGNPIGDYSQRLSIAKSAHWLEGIPLKNIRSTIENRIETDNDLIRLANHLEIKNKTDNISERTVHDILSLIHYIIYDHIYSVDKILQKHVHFNHLNILRNTRNLLQSNMDIYDINFEGILSEIIQGCIILNPANTVLFNYSSLYMKQIKEFAFPRGFCCCFTDNYSLPSMWGHYADNNRGVALIFDYDEKQSIKLKQLCEKGDSKGHSEIITINKVKYTNKFPTYNFFLSIGTCFGDERTHWLCSCGKKSTVLDDAIKNNSEYANDYYTFAQNRLLQKCTCWDKENEYRLTIDNSWYDYGKSEPCKFMYNFSDLKGIIFGIYTPDDKKKEIITLIYNKCRENNIKDFQFYQSYFNGEGHIKSYPLKWINNIIYNHEHNDPSPAPA